MAKKKQVGPGRPPLKNPRDQRLEIRLTGAEMTRLDRAARAQGLTVSELVRLAVERFLSQGRKG